MFLFNDECVELLFSRFLLTKVSFTLYLFSGSSIQDYEIISAIQEFKKFKFEMRNVRVIAYLHTFHFHPAPLHLYMAHLVLTQLGDYLL